MRKLSLRLIAMTLMTMALASCVDESYDLDDIDLTIQVGSGENVLWLPNSSVFDKIYVDSLLTADAKDIVHTGRNPENDETIYVLEGSGVDHLLIFQKTVGSLELNIDNQNVDLLDVKDQYPLFTNDGTVLDIENPALLVDIHNQNQANLLVNLRLSAVADGEIVKSLSDIQLASAPGHTRYYLAKKRYSAAQEAEYFPGAQWVEFPNAAGETVTSLIYNTPDNLKMEVTRAVLSDERQLANFVPAQMAVDYTIKTPLRFGRDFCLVYADTLDGWKDDAEDLEKVDIEQLVAEATVENSTPLDLRIQLIAQDEEGNVLKEIQFTEAEVKAMKSVQKVEMTARNTRYNDGTYALQQLDDVILRVYMHGSEGHQGEILKPSDFFRIPKFRVGLKGSVIIDANDKDDEYNGEYDYEYYM